MKIKDRIREFKRVPVSQLIPNDKNWRTHSKKQKKVLNGILNEIGFADALLVRELENGSYQLIDGHLRADTIDKNAEVPVLILDLNEDEAQKLLLLFDSVTELAGENNSILDKILPDINFNCEALTQFANKRFGSFFNFEDIVKKPEISVPAVFQVVIECQNEQDQQTVYNKMTAEGYRCKILNI